MRQIVGALALPCPLEYFDVSQRLFELVLDIFRTNKVYILPPAFLKLV
ncbi:hypothetical protein NIES22_03580 [Calothrix brevissima NIES-22]|nr:hypothetical protein NIES22_03580 [Calothrix brevissima NIES-22]